jgi:membrane protein
MLDLANSLRRAFLAAVAHDCFNLAQATAYSGIVAISPALIVSAALLRVIPDTSALQTQTSDVFSHILPASAMPIVRGYFAATQHSAGAHHLILSALFVSILGASGVIVTLMESFRRAYEQPLHDWGFWHKRWISILLVPLSLLPLAIVSVLVVFGHVLTMWIWYAVAPALRTFVIVLVLILRWAVAVACSVSVIAVIYYKGTPVRQSFRRTLPGAAIATGLWFISTLVFGWYVTRYTDYSKFYGSLGAAIGLLIWIYIIALSVISGAEFNAQLFDRKLASPLDKIAAINVMRKQKRAVSEQKIT